MYRYKLRTTLREAPVQLKLNSVNSVLSNIFSKYLNNQYISCRRHRVSILALLVMVLLVRDDGHAFISGKTCFSWWVKHRAPLHDYNKQLWSVDTRRSHDHIHNMLVPDNTELDLIHLGSEYHVTIWDCPGQEDYDSLRPRDIYRHCNVFVLMYSVTGHNSYENLSSWVERMTGNYVNGRNKIVDNNVKFVLVGNKADLEDKRVITTAQGREFAKKYSMPFLEISCETGDNVLEALHLAIDLVIATDYKELVQKGEKCLKEGIKLEKHAQKLVKRNSVNMLDAQNEIESARALYTEAIDLLTSVATRTVTKKTKKYLMEAKTRLKSLMLDPKLSIDIAIPYEMLMMGVQPSAPPLYDDDDDIVPSAPPNDIDHEYEYGDNVRDNVPSAPGEDEDEESETSTHVVDANCETHHNQPVPDNNNTSDSVVNAEDSSLDLVISFQHPIDVSCFRDDSLPRVWSQVIKHLRTKSCLVERVIACQAAYDIAVRTHNDKAKQHVLELMNIYISQAFCVTSRDGTDMLKLISDLQRGCPPVLAIKEELMVPILMTLMSVVVNNYIRIQLDAKLDDDNIRLGVNDILSDILDKIDEQSDMCLQTAWYINCASVARQLYSNISERISKIRELSGGASSSSQSLSNNKLVDQLQQLVVPHVQPISAENHISHQDKARVYA